MKLPCEYEDGVVGSSGAQIGVHWRGCAKYGIAPGLEAYRLGRTEGLASCFACATTRGED